MTGTRSPRVGRSGRAGDQDCSETGSRQPPFRVEAGRRSGHCEDPQTPRHPDLVMSRVYLIRHAKPSATWGGDDDDPGLDELGHSQAKRAAEALLALPPEHRPTRVVSSPLRRCQETARPFAQAIGARLEIDPAVGEIPTPSALTAEERGPWLRSAFGGCWTDIEGD